MKGNLCPVQLLLYSCLELSKSVLQPCIIFVCKKIEISTCFVFADA